MKKRVLSIILALCLLASAIPGLGLTASAAAYANVCTGNQHGRVNGVSACVNADGALHLCKNNFPDAAFLEQVSKLDADSDGYLSMEELNSVETLDGFSEATASMVGIGYFKNLRNLYLSGTKVTSLDITANTQLQTLSCSNCGMTTLTMNNPALQYLDCSYNLLTALNLQNAPNLETLLCASNNLSSLDVSACTKLTSLDCSNNLLASLDLSKNTVLSARSAKFSGQSVSNRNKYYQTSSGYIVNMADLVGASNLASVYQVSIGSYDMTTGYVYFANPVSTISYTYNTHLPMATTAGESGMEVQMLPAGPSEMSATITFLYNNTRTSITAKVGDVLDLSKYTPTQSGYTFDGWYTEVDRVGYIGNTLKVTGDATLYGSFEPSENSATITLLYDSTQRSITAKVGDVLDLSRYTPTKTGYTFNGWYMEPDGIGYIGNTLKVTGDTTLNGYFSQTGTSATITFLYNNTRTSITAKVGDVLDLSRYTPTQAGYTFDGWYMEPDGIGYIGNTLKVTGDTTLNGYFNPVATDPYTLSFDTQGGSDLAPRTYTAGTTVALANFIPRRDGYTFLGWHLATSGTILTSVTMDSSKTLYATWQKDSSYCTVTLYSTPDIVTAFLVATGSELDLTKYGTSWYYDAGLLYAAPNKVTITTDTTFYSGSQKTYTLTLNLVNSNPIDGSTTTYLHKLQAGSVFDLTSYAGTAWYYDEAQTKAAPFWITMTGDLTLYGVTHSSQVLVYNNTDGSNLSMIKFPVGATVNVNDYAPKVEKDGYILKGWRLEDSDSVVTNITFDPTGDKIMHTVYPVWEPAAGTCTVHLYYNGAVYRTFDVAAGTVIDLDRYYPPTNYFVTWYYDAAATKPSGTNVTVNSNLNLYSIPTNAPQRYTLTFQTGNNTAPPAPITVAAGTVIDLTKYKPTMDGYTFNGWYRSDATSMTYLTSITMDANYTLMGSWSPVTPVSYSLILVPGNGTADISLQVAAGTVVDLRSYVPTWAGHTFKGWCWDSTFGTISRILMDQDYSLFAVWDTDTPDTYTVTLNPAPMAGVLWQPTVKAGGTLNLTDYVPTVTDKIFTGWFYDVNCTQPAGNSITVNSNLTLYAGWRDASADISVTLYDNLNDGFLGTLHVKYGDTVDLDKYTVVRDDFKFNGWIDPTNNKAYSGTISITNNLVLYASWNGTTSVATLTLLPGNGSANTSIRVPVGTQVNLYKYMPTWAGHEFRGWITADGAFYYGTAPVQVDRDMTLVAEWDAIIPSYTVRLVLGNGSDDINLTVPSGSLIDLTQYTPSWDGHIFRGWMSPNYSGGDTLKVTGNVVLTAQWESNDPASYTVSLYYNGQKYKSVTVKAGTSYRLGSDYPPTNAIVTWCYDAACTNLVDAYSVVITKDISFYAIPTNPVERHTLTFQTGNSPTKINPVVVPVGTTINLESYVPTPPSGYVFKGWYIQQGADLMQVSSVTMNADYTVVAQYEPTGTQTYTLTFQTNGGTAIDPITVPAGTVIDLTRYTTSWGTLAFLGWKAEQGGTPILREITMDSNKTVYAAWSNIPETFYTVTFNTGYGSHIDAISVRPGTKVDLTPYVPTSGDPTKVFGGWYLSSGAVAGTALTVTRDTVLTAKWVDVAETYTLTFGGNNAYPALTVPAGTVVDLTPYNPGDGFRGWSPYATHYGILVSEITMDSDKTIYPVWSSTPYFTLTFNTLGGSAIAPILVYPGYSLDLTQYVSTRPGYTFQGWSLDGQPVTNLPIDKSMTITAIWAPAKTYTLTFDSQGGSAVSSITVPAGTVVNLTKYTSTWANHTFTGWVDAINSDLLFLAEITMDGDKTVYARWNYTQPVSAVVFESNGGSHVKAVYVQRGSTFDLSKYTSEKAGYVFTGWYSDTALTNRVTTLTVQSNVTVYAGWRQFVEPQGGLNIVPTKPGLDYIPLKGAWAGNSALDLEIRDNEGTLIPNEALEWGIAADSSKKYGFSSPCVTVENGKLVVQQSGICEVTVAYGDYSTSMVVVVPGDYTRDGRLNSADCTSAVDIVTMDAELNDLPYSKELLDINGDGRVNTADITLLIDLAVGDLSLS